MAYQYEYPRPAVSVDNVVFQEINKSLHLLLIQRKNEPFQHQWALPGGFLDMHETLEEAAARELKEETGLEAVSLEQLGAYSTVDRDPRTRVISVAFKIHVAAGDKPAAADDALDAQWFPVDQLPPLAFDHQQIVSDALV